MIWVNENLDKTEHKKVDRIALIRKILTVELKKLSNEHEIK